MIWGKKEQIKYYELFPKVEYDKSFNIINSLGHVFEIIYAKDKDLMHIYAYTNTQLEVLRKDFGVNENVDVPVPKLVGRISFRNEKDFYWGAEFNDFNSFLTKLQPGEQLLSIPSRIIEREKRRRAGVAVTAFNSIKDYLNIFIP